MWVNCRYYGKKKHIEKMLIWKDPSLGVSH